MKIQVLNKALESLISAPFIKKVGSLSLLLGFSILGLSQTQNISTAPFNRTAATITGQRYKVIMVGSSSVQQTSGVCLGAEAPNNDAGTNVQKVTIGADNASSATVLQSQLGNGCTSKVKRAFLYWGGSRGHDMSTSDYTYWNQNIRIKAPGGAWQTVTAQNWGIPTNSTSTDNRTPYYCFADVTTQLLNAGAGVFTIGDVDFNIVSGTEGGTVGAWNLILMYESTEYPLMDFYLWDGITWKSNDGVNLVKAAPITAPASGDISSFVGIAAMDGDVSDGTSKAESLTFQSNNGGPLQNLNTIRGVTDFLSSTMTYDGNQFPRYPDCINTFGYDAHHLDLPDGSVTNGATTATITVIPSSGDQSIYPFMLYMGIIKNQSQLRVTKVASSSSVQFGQTYQYMIIAENIGGRATSSQSAEKNMLRDTLDYNVIFSGLVSDITVKINGVAVTYNTQSDITWNATTRALELRNLPIIPKSGTLVATYKVTVPDASRSDLWRMSCMHDIYNKANITYYDDGVTPSKQFQVSSGQDGCNIGDYTVTPIVADFTQFTKPSDVVKVVSPSDLTILDLKAYLQLALSNHLGTTTGISDFTFTKTTGPSTGTVASGVSVTTATVGNYTNGNGIYTATRTVATHPGKPAVCSETYTIKLVYCSNNTLSLAVTPENIVCAAAQNGKIIPSVSGNQGTTMIYTLATGMPASISDVNTTNLVKTSGETTGTGNTSYTFSSLSAGTYTVFAIDGLGCVQKSPVTLSDPAPIAVNLTSTQACVGERIEFTAVASGGVSGTYYGYKWYRSSDNGATFTQVDCQNQPDKYDVTSQQTSVTMKVVAYSLTAECADVICTGSATLTVTLSQTPQLSCANKTICGGDKVTIKPVDAKAQTISSRIWRQSADSITWSKRTETADSLVISPIVTMFYRAIFITPGGCADSIDVKVHVNTKPSIKDLKDTICNGKSFSVQPTNGVNGNIVPTGTLYTWAAPAPITGISGLSAGTSKTAISDTLTNSTSAPINVQYKIIATTPTACLDTFYITTTVNPTPRLSSSLTPGDICSSKTAANFIYTASSATSGASYSWTRAVVAGISNTSGSGLSGSISETLTNTGSTPVTVSYIFTTSANGCSGNDTVKVTVKSTPAIPTINNYVSCPLTVSTMEPWTSLITATGSLSWYKDSLLTTTAMATAPSDFDKAVSQDTSFWVSQTINGCEGPRAKVHVKISSSPVKPSVVPYNACAISSGTPIAWSSRVTTSGTQAWYADTTSASPTALSTFSISTPDTLSYWVAVTDAAGCISARAKVTVEVKTRPSAVISGDTTICQGSSANIKVKFKGTAPFNFSYSPDGGTTVVPVPGINVNAYTFSVTPTAGKTYKLVSFSDAICNAESSDLTGSATVTVNEAVTAKAGKDTVITCICSAATTSINMYAIAATHGTGVWSLVSKSASASNPTIVSPNSETSSVTGLKAGDYIFKWKIVNGTCSDSDNVTVSVKADTIKPKITGTVADTMALSSGSCVFKIPDLKEVVRKLSSDNCTTDRTLLTITQSPAENTVITGTTKVTVKVADLCGNFDTISIKVLVPAPIVVKNSVYNPLCYGALGSDTVSISGGKPQYQYSLTGGAPWTNISNGDVISNLSKGSFTVTIMDYNGCTKAIASSITVPDSISATLNKMDITVFGYTDGAITYKNLSGGNKASIEFKIVGKETISGNSVAKGYGDSTSVLTGLASGKYTVYARNVGQTCVFNLGTIDILSPGDIKGVVTKDSVHCFGASTATINLTKVTGGNKIHGYTYQLEKKVSGVYTPYTGYAYGAITSDTTHKFSNLPAGTYRVKVKDDNTPIANEAVVASDIVIYQPDSLVAKSSKVTNLTCWSSADGSAKVSVIGGTKVGNYNYSWNSTPVQTDSIAKNLTAGNYIVTVSDFYGCQDTAKVTITRPDSLIAKITSSKNVSCKSGNNGSATVGVSGGTIASAYTYKWNTIPQQNTATANNLTAGNYIVTVTDDHGCQDTAQVTIKEPALLVASVVSQTNVKCHGGATGAVQVNVNGGTPSVVNSYSYSWNTNPIQTIKNAVNLKAGTYILTVTDSLLCQDTAKVIITQADTLTASISSTTDVKCKGDNTGSITVSATGGTGTLSYLWNDAAAQSTQIASSLLAGTYQVTVTDINSCKATAKATIKEPTQALAASATAAAPICSTGTSAVKLSVSGGTPDASGKYLYKLSTGTWTSFANGDSVKGLSQGTYTFSVKDVNNCTVPDFTATVDIYTPATLTKTSGSDNQVLCASDRTIENIVYTYGGGANGVSVTGLPVGLTATTNATAKTVTISGTITSAAASTYKYIVTTTGESSPCTAAKDNGTITINQAAAITLTSAAGTNSQILCSNSGTITNITYSITGATGASITGLPAGISGSVSGGALIISGTTTVTGAYRYIITTTAGNSPCAVAKDSGTITINQAAVIKLTSAASTASQTLCISSPTITNITYSLTGATGASVAPLPAGISYGVSGGVLTISGTATTTGTYRYIITTTGGNSPCAAAKDSGTITINSLPSVTNTSLSQTICSGSTTTPVTLTSSIANTNYTWTGSATPGVSGYTSGTGNLSAQAISVNSTVSGTVTYSIKPTANGCVGLNVNYVVTVNVLPTVTVSTLTSVCEGSSLVFKASPSTYTAYEWTIKPALSSSFTDGSQTGSVYTVSNKTSAQAVQASVVVTGSNGCKSLSASASGTINAVPSFPFVRNYTTCATSGLVSWNNLVKTSSGTVNWYDSSAKTTTINPINVSKSTPKKTTLYASVVSTAGCESPAVPVSVTVYENPNITSVDKTDLNNIKLTVISGTAPYNYAMGSSAGVFSEIADLGAVGFGLHEITVVDTNGCKADTSFVIEEVPLNPAKYFTPNGDGSNDTWTIENIAYYPKSEIYIYDRFGKQVAYYKGADFEGWNGVYLGNPLPSTDYWYVILVRETGKRLTGHFLLKR
ncbi:MAG: T9SS type B sorting domain-containing protein [Paludibacteraceae bacterium]|nr:T9SS type B sorting domain-containing protein [Paludibacteraceae bacterium]